MKWYKKQLDKLKLLKPKPEVSETDKKIPAKTNRGYAVDERTRWVKVKKFRNPVAASKLNRPKTDLP